MAELSPFEMYVNELELRLAASRKQSYTKLGELRKFLGLPAAVEKTPSVSLDA